MKDYTKNVISRRKMLKSTAAMGAAAGASIMLGCPAVHANEAPTIRYLGTAVNMGSEPEKRLFEDTGIKVKYISKTTDEVVKTILTQPNSFDIVDSEYFSMPKLVPSGSLLGMDTKRIKEWDNVVTAFTEGKVGGKTIGDQGTAPKKVLYLKGANSKEFSSEPSRYVTLIPTVYNADTLGIRPDLINRPINTWAELLNPEFKGKACILNIPSIGIMDAAMVVEASTTIAASIMPIEGIFKIHALPLNSGFKSSAQVFMGRLIRSGLIPRVSALYTVGINVTYLLGSDENSFELAPFK